MELLKVVPFRIIERLLVRPAALAAVPVAKIKLPDVVVAFPSVMAVVLAAPIDLKSVIANPPCTFTGPSNVDPVPVIVRMPEPVLVRM